MTDQSPAISVIIPCFNDGAYIQEAICSLDAQSFRNWEAIVVDDGSTDHATRSVLTGLEHPRVRVLKHDTNRGLSAARNTGMATAVAPIVFPLDADDRLPPTSLQVAVELLEEHPAVGLVYSDVRRFGATSGTMKMPDSDFDSMIRQRFPLSCSPVRRSHVEAAGGFCEDSVFHDGMEDIEYHVRLMGSGCVYRKTDTILYEYRAKKESLAGRMQGRYYILIKEIADRHPDMFHSGRRARFLWYGAVRDMRVAAHLGARKEFLTSFARATTQYRAYPRALWSTLWSAKEGIKSWGSATEGNPS